MRKNKELSLLEKIKASDEFIDLLYKTEWPRHFSQNIEKHIYVPQASHVKWGFRMVLTFFSKVGELERGK